MGWIQERNGTFHLGLRIGDRQVERSLGTSDRREAEELAARVERRLRLVEHGDLVVPLGSRPADV